MVVSSGAVVVELFWVTLLILKGLSPRLLTLKVLVKSVPGSTTPTFRRGGSTCRAPTISAESWVSINGGLSLVVRAVERAWTVPRGAVGRSVYSTTDSLPGSPSRSIGLVLTTRVVMKRPLVLLA